MNAEQHAKVLEALEALINDPGDDHIKSSTWDKAREAISIMRAEAVGWQPIETAPKDGTTLLLAGKKARMADGDWHSLAKAWNWPYVNAEPTHWMPLPAAPCHTTEQPTKGGTTE